MPRTIRVAHSPDSDDAFMFYALAEGKIDTGELRYEHELQDIETLNQRARRAELDVSAVSIHAYAYLAGDYALLGSGSSMGDGYGPRLVATTPPPADRVTGSATNREAARGTRIAVPGRYTTAYLALRLWQPEFEPVFMAFDAIEDAVHAGEVDLGLIIHEGQLTYADDGLHLWADMGEWWLAETGLPLPLGGNVVRRDLGPEVIAQVARDLKASIEYSLAHRADALAHASRYNRGISDARTDEFVGMYVNAWTVDYGERGRAAVQLLLDRAASAGIIPAPVQVEFV
ncbi:MAG: menaquinone biosynthesis family protein [Gemmatimonadales bacterium]